MREQTVRFRTPSETLYIARLEKSIKEMTLHLLKKKPKKVVDAMIEWLDQHGYDMFGIRSRIGPRLNYEPIEIAQLESQEIVIESVSEPPKPVPLVQVKKVNGNRHRSSISAEAFGRFNPKAQFLARVIPKSDAAKQSIRQIMARCFILSHLQEPQVSIIIEAMEIKNFKRGEFVIKEGDEGNELFLVSSGKFECFKTLADGKELYLKEYNQGEYFGELALLYNTRRAASIRALTESEVLCLDRPCFNSIVRESVIRQRELLQEFLAKVEILESLSHNEINQIADVIQVKNYQPGEYVITQGEVGLLFFLVVEGTAEAFVTSSPGEEPKMVMTYSSGGYFGELALIREAPRAASVIAKVI